MDINKIKKLLDEFSKDRGWDKVHSPKNISMAMSVEVSELVEIFQWLSEEESLKLNSDSKEHVKEEVADVTIYIILMCLKLNINLEEAVLDKIELNRKKHPIN